MTRTSYGKDFKAQVLKRADETGVKHAAEEFNISPQLLYNWRTKARKDENEQGGEKTKRTSGKYSAEFKAQVLERAGEIGVQAAAREFKIAWQTITYWKRKAKSENSAVYASSEGASAAAAEPPEAITAAEIPGSVKYGASASVNTDTDQADPAAETGELPAKEAFLADKPVKNAPNEPMSLEVEAAVLKADNALLREQVERLRRALKELM